jgi:hypothetical protein
VHKDYSNGKRTQAQRKLQSQDVRAFLIRKSTSSPTADIFDGLVGSVAPVPDSKSHGSIRLQGLHSKSVRLSQEVRLYSVVPSDRRLLKIDGNNEHEGM